MRRLTLFLVLTVTALSSTAVAQEIPDAPTHSRIAPERVGNVIDSSARLRLFPALGTIGVGGLLDLSAAYRFSAPVVVGIELTPLALGVARSGNIASYAANVNVGLDTRYFEMRLGFGSACVSTLVPGHARALTSAFASYQMARIGAADGLNVQFRTRISIVDDRFEVTGGGGSFQIPITDDLALIADFDFANRAYATGGGGVRYRLHGEEGERHALFLSGTLGASYLDSGTRSYGGPAIGGAIQWRE